MRTTLGWHLEVAGKRLEVLSQHNDGMSEPLTAEVLRQAKAGWDGMDEAMGWARYESEQRGGIAVDVVSGAGPEVRVAYLPDPAASDALEGTLELREGFAA